MTPPDDGYDIVLDAKKRVNGPYDPDFVEAKAASEAGTLKLVDEFVLDPDTGRGFELEKGQVVRYELIEGAQILDTFSMVTSRPIEE